MNKETKLRRIEDVVSFCFNDGMMSKKEALSTVQDLLDNKTKSYKKVLKVIIAREKVM